MLARRWPKFTAAELVVHGRVSEPFCHGELHPPAGPERILNIHPSLIPSFCGKGFYGLEGPSGRAGLRREGHGRDRPFCQRGARRGRDPPAKGRGRVSPRDTPEVLQRRVMEQAEWELLPQPCADDVAEENGQRRTQNERLRNLRPWPHCMAGQHLPRPGHRPGEATPDGTAGGRRLLHHGPQRQQPQPGVCSPAGTACAFTEAL